MKTRNWHLALKANMFVVVVKECLLSCHFKQSVHPMSWSVSQTYQSSGKSRNNKERVL